MATVEEKRPLATLDPISVPISPGVYALFRDYDVICVGSASNLRERIAMTAGRGPDPPARRGGPAFDRWAGAPPTGCDVSWIECGSAELAHALELELEAEPRPPRP